jgi:Flp pilus assembly protein TadD
MNTSPPSAAESNAPAPTVSAAVASRSCRPVWLLAGLLALITIAMFWPALSHGFINYDDPLYVTSNVHVKTGFTWHNIQWAFGHPVVGNWHPATVLSHMLDCQIYGLTPWGHHLTNILLHAANTALLFLLLFRLTGVVWRSWIVAALFGLHPLHVESVAWVAERKDVLSTFFGLLCLIAYGCYVQGKTKSSSSSSSLAAPKRSEGGSSTSPFYLLSLLFFTLGLMSKPMLVTIPFVMLLLDYWPLNRFNASTFQRFNALAVAKPSDDASTLQRFNASTSPLVEKIPFFTLAAAMCLLTYIVQRQTGMMNSLETVPLGARVGNALISYCRYLEKLFWPTHLAVFYPYPQPPWPMDLVVLAATAMAAISAFVFFLRTHHPWLLTGWLWFCGTLVPVIGLVQVGGQAMADRYTYLPSIGIFILVVWGACELAKRWSYHAPALGGASCIALILCAGLTRQQLGYWQNDETLYCHALATTKNNYLARHNLGIALFKEGKIDDAINQYREALQLEPENSEARYNLGAALAAEGRTDDAIRNFQKAIQLNPGYAAAHANFGAALSSEGRLGEAISQFREAVRLQPDNAEVHYDLGTALGMTGRIDDAIAQFQEALRLQPDYPAAQNNLAHALQIKNTGSGR